jgi:hypothetical protein
VPETIHESHYRFSEARGHYRPTLSIISRTCPAAASQFEVQTKIILGQTNIRRSKTRFDAKQSAKLTTNHQPALTAQPVKVPDVHGFDQDSAVLRREPGQLLCSLRIFASGFSQRTCCPF